MGDSGLTVTKDEQLFTFPYCNLGKQWEKVVWDTLGVFTHNTTGMRACRIEVAEECSVPVVAGFALLFEIVALSFDVVCDARFNGRLCAAVGIRRADWANFRNGYHIFKAGSITVDGGRRGEDDMRDIVTCHGG